MTAYQGVRILDCSQGRVGPMAAMLMADFGAEVLKLEPPEGDRAAATTGYAMWNRNKRRMVLDIASAEGRERLDAFLAAADVAVFDQSPRRMEALDLLADRHPRLVTLWTPPYGVTGLWSELEAHHGALMALTGGAFRQSSYSGQPVYLVAPIIHYAQATMAAGAAGAALLERASSGLGQRVTVSGLDAVALLGGASGMMMHGGHPLGASPSYRLYECGDGRFLFLATLFGDFFWRAIQALGLANARVGGFSYNLTRVLEARFREKPRDAWVAILQAADVPVGPVGRREDWLASKIIANNDMRAVIDDERLGRVEMPGVPVRLARTPGSVRRLVRDAAPAEVEAFACPAPDNIGRGLARGGPLAGIRVLDLGTLIAGAYAGGILANLGAEVIKVESAQGDPWRDSYGFASYNRGKRSLVVDLKRASGQALFLDLVRKADVVIDNYRLGVRDRLGVGHEAVMAANPRVISCSITTFGAKGQDARRPGFDALLQACSGLMAAQGGDGDEPVLHSVAINDLATAAMAAFGVITALNARARTGEGQVAETSLAAQSAIFQAGELTTWPGAPAAPKGCRDCLGVSALDRFYACADGWILVACGKAEDATALAGALGHPEWADQFDMIGEPRDGALAVHLAETLATCRVGEALAILLEAGVTAAPVRFGDEILGDRWLWENGLFEARRATPFGPVADRPYAAFSRTAAGYARPDPGLGEHSFEVLAEWGVDPDRIRKLAEDGVVMRLY